MLGMIQLRSKPRLLSGNEFAESPAYMFTARPHCRQLLAQRVLSALVFALARAGKSSPAKMAMMATTTSNSISVNAGRRICRDNGEVVTVIIQWLGGCGLGLLLH